VLGLTCPRAQDAGPHAMFADEMRLCADIAVLDWIATEGRRQPRSHFPI
jgi:hypothetical protein